MRLRLGELASFAAGLDLDVGRTPICYACLSFVSFPLDDGDEREARSAARRMTPHSWVEGRAEPARDAGRRALDEGVRGAGRALADLETCGGRSVVARAIVLRLAADLAVRTRTELHVEAVARERLALAPPEWN